jgi:hypothetical protein
VYIVIDPLKELDWTAADALVEFERRQQQRGNNDDIDDNPKCDTCRAPFHCRSAAAANLYTPPPRPSLRSVALYILITTLFNVSTLLFALLWYATSMAVLDESNRVSFFLFALACHTAITPPSRAIMDSSHRYCASILRWLQVDFDSPRRNPNHVRDLQAPLLSSACRWGWTNFKRPRTSLLSRLVYPLFLPLDVSAPTTMYWHKYAIKYLATTTHQCAVQGATLKQQEDDEEDDSEEEHNGQQAGIFCLSTFQKYIAQYVIILLVTQVIDISLGSDTLDLIGLLVTVYVVGIVTFSCFAERSLRLDTSAHRS